jgi:hypothetical protein
MALKFRRKLNETWVFDLTAQDRTGARQSLSGVSDLAATLRRQVDGVVVWEDDHAGCTIVEVGTPTAGDFQYKRADLTGVDRGTTYLLDFNATINGDPIEFPEDSYVIVEVI